MKPCTGKPNLSHFGVRYAVRHKNRHRKCAPRPETGNDFYGLSWPFRESMNKPTRLNSAVHYCVRNSKDSG